MSLQNRLRSEAPTTPGTGKPPEDPRYPCEERSHKDMVSQCFSQECLNSLKATGRITHVEQM